jgi:hypothetical protein
MPVTTADGPHGPTRTSKYLSEFSTFSYGIFQYGAEPWCMAGVTDISVAADASLVAHPDVFKLPDDLDQTMGSVGNRNQARNALEAVNMPGTWIQTSDTYRTVVRFIGSLCLYMGCFNDHYDLPVIFDGTTTLSTLFSALTQSQRDAMQGCADYFGLDGSSLIGSNSLRIILKAIGDDFSAQYALGTNPMTRLDLAGPL